MMWEDFIDILNFAFIANDMWKTWLILVGCLAVFVILSSRRK